MVVPSPGISASTNSDTLTTEDKELYAFLVEQHKKSVSEEIRQGNREKKIQREEGDRALQSVPIPPASPPCTSETIAIVDSNSSRDIKPVNNVNGFPPKLSHETDRGDHLSETENANVSPEGNPVLNNSNTASEEEKLEESRDIKPVNNVNGFSENLIIVTEYVQRLMQELLSPGSRDPESIKFSSPVASSASVSLEKQSPWDQLANLFYQANNAKKNTIKAKRTEIASWGYYSERFEDKIVELRSEDKKLTDQTARKRIYNEMKPFLTGVSDGYLRVMTCKARKINKLFGYEYDPVSLEKNNGIGWDMIPRVTCSVDSISRLTNSQIKYIIDQVKLKPVNSDNDRRHESDDGASAVPQESFANVDEGDIDFGLDDEIFDDKSGDDDESDIDFGLDDEILDDKSGDNVFDEILDGTPDLPVDLNHPINARTEGISVQA
ncbi:unnamed protein product [Rhizophagus irregularis]|nr:unnamed protein product [Rhizophagus irregularis]